MDTGTILVLAVVSFIGTILSVSIGALTSEPADVRSQHLGEATPPRLTMGIALIAAIASAVFGWIALVVAVAAGFVVGKVIETMIWARMTPEKREVWFKDALERKEKREEEKRQREERKRQQVEQKEQALHREAEVRLTKAREKGVFAVYYEGEKLEIGGAACYLYVGGPGMRLQGSKKKVKDTLSVDEKGLHFGNLLCFKGKTAAALNIGGMSTASLISGALTTESLEVSAVWADVRRCIVNTITKTEYYFLFYRHVAKSREEWLAVYLASPEERQFFRETLESHGVKVEDVAEPLIKY